MPNGSGGTPVGGACETQGTRPPAQTPARTCGVAAAGGWGPRHLSPAEADAAVNTRVAGRGAAKRTRGGQTDAARQAALVAARPHWVPPPSGEEGNANGNAWPGGRPRGGGGGGGRGGAHPASAADTGQRAVAHQRGTPPLKGGASCCHAPPPRQTRRRPLPPRTGCSKRRAHRARRLGPKRLASPGGARGGRPVGGAPTGCGGWGQKRWRVQAALTDPHTKYQQ